MSQMNAKQILLSPLKLVRLSNEEERGLFADKRDGYFYTIGLSSGQSFVAHLNRQEDVFTLRPKDNLLPHLTQVEWRKRSSVEDLGFDTFCLVTPDASKDEALHYEEILSPVPEDETKYALTKIAFKHYQYPELLKRLLDLKEASLVSERIQKNLLRAQRKLRSLFLSDKKSEGNSFVQKQEREGR